MISLNKVCKSFNGKEVLKDISLNIEKGEIFGIVGLSGAGKSTLVRLINRLEKVDSGNILVDGVDVVNISNQKLQKLRKEVSMIFQSFNLLSSRTVYENVSLALEINSMSNSEEKHNKIEQVLKLVELFDKKDEYINKLSGGQKQRVAIARALVTDPKIILSDESTSALDPITANNILDLLKKINKELNITIVVITHQMEVIKKICDKLLVLKDGVVLEQGTVKDVFLRPKNSFTRNLIGTLQGEKSNNKTWILHFLGTHANKSYISMASKLFSVNINILGGNIHTLSKGEKVGYLRVELEADNVDEIIEWFKSNKIEVEELND